MNAPLPIDHAVIMVRSLAASMPYYDALLPLLGFEKRRAHVWANALGFHLQFHEATAESRDYERYGPGLNHLGFSAPNPETVRAVREAMAAAGFAVPEIQDLDGATALFMKDPDGLRFEVTCYPPGASVVD